MEIIGISNDQQVITEWSEKHGELSVADCDSYAEICDILNEIGDSW